MAEANQPVQQEMSQEDKLSNSIRLLDIAIYVVGDRPLTAENLEAVSQAHNFLKQVRQNAVNELEALKAAPKA